MTTIREVAQKAGVSYTTVSHVVNNTRFVSDDTRQRVLAAMKELGYRPNALARSLRRGETFTIGLILPDSANPFFAEIGRSIEDTAFRQGYNVILCNSENDLEKEQHYVDVLSKKQVDGILFVAAGDQINSIEYCIHSGIPYVIIDRELSGLEADTVLIDNHQGGYLATQYLISLGHHRIACITGPSHLTPSAQRVTGYCDALRDYGLPVDDTLIVRGDFHPHSGWQAAFELLRLPDSPTAVFACNDLLAIGALNAAVASGRRVPADLAIVGFDDIELASYTNPPLTTVSQPKTEMGRVAFQLLIDRITANDRPVQRVVLPSRLIIRGSCGGKSA
jgi:LacI family transcriptional regulator